MQLGFSLCLPSVSFSLSFLFYIFLLLLTCCRGRCPASKPGRWGCWSSQGRRSPPCPTLGMRRARPAWSTDTWSAPGSSHPTHTHAHKQTFKEKKAQYLGHYTPVQCFVQCVIKSDSNDIRNLEWKMHTCNWPLDWERQDWANENPPRWDPVFMELD